MKFVYVINKYSKFVAIIPKKSSISIENTKKIVGDKYSILPKNVSEHDKKIYIREIVLRDRKFKMDKIIHVNCITSKNISSLLIDKEKNAKTIQKELLNILANTH